MVTGWRISLPGWIASCVVSGEAGLSGPPEGAVGCLFPYVL